jgi:hypothetical protein
VEFERLAYETARQSLQQQAILLDELRSRTGVLLAASSLAASFLGAQAFRDPEPVLAVLALAAFAVSLGASVYVLLPKRDQFVFSPSGRGLYEGLYAFREDLAEVYRRLAYDLDRFWDANDRQLHQATAGISDRRPQPRDRDPRACRARQRYLVLSDGLDSQHRSSAGSKPERDTAASASPSPRPTPGLGRPETRGGDAANQK